MTYTSLASPVKYKMYSNLAINEVILYKMAMLV